jgi:hypothetical protein
MHGHMYITPRPELRSALLLYIVGAALSYTLNCGPIAAAARRALVSQSRLVGCFAACYA